MRNKGFILLFFLLSLKMSSQMLPPGEIDKSFLTGNIDYRNDPGFVKVKDEHSSKSVYLIREVYDAFTEMYNSARKEGISLRIISGTRNFEEQKVIWQRKWEAHKHLHPQTRLEKILEFSSMPATSRHHWGTDIDLNNLGNSYFESGKGKAEYDWLVRNAGRFGFAQVYTSQDSGRTGYAEEKWHWSYLPLADPYLQFYNDNIGYADIYGFDGSELAEKNQMIAHYVNGISQDTGKPLLLLVTTEETDPQEPDQ